MSVHAKPIAPSERIAEMDIIRGFALLGIFIMNMPLFGLSPFAGADGSHLFPLWYDRVAEEAREVLFAGKFNSMFSFLFTVGFTIQLSRLEATDPKLAFGIYLRRIQTLLALGLTHAFVFWAGDVLHMYAVLGLCAAQVPAWRRRFAPIACAGRMPLSNYLLQTAMGIFIFRAWGLGYWSKVGPLAGLILASALYFIIQLPLSVWWFRHFRYGPLEYLWRAATYGRLPKMRLEIDPAAA